MSDLARSPMTSTINLPDTFCDNLRQLMHEHFNIPYSNFTYEFNYESVTLYGPGIAVPYLTEYTAPKDKGGIALRVATQSYHLRYSFGKTKVTVWKVAKALDNSTVTEDTKVYVLCGVKEWTPLEILELKRQLMTIFPPDWIVGPVVCGASTEKV